MEEGRGHTRARPGRLASDKELPSSASRQAAAELGHQGTGPHLLEGLRLRREPPPSVHPNSCSRSDSARTGSSPEMPTWRLNFDLGDFDTGAGAAQARAPHLPPA